MSLPANPAGRLQLLAGQAPPNISSSRPELAARLAEGRAVETLPSLMGALFTLCAMPHRLASAAAVAAAAGRPFEFSVEDRHQLRMSQAREQILRISHDWPRLWPDAMPAIDTTALLRSCPLWQAEASSSTAMTAVHEWMVTCWLCSNPAAWLAAHAHDPQHYAAQWCAEQAGPVAQTLRAMRGSAQRLPTPHQPLRVLANVEREMPALTRRMLNETGFCSQPDNHGFSADTGPWSRANAAQVLVADSAWQRLVSRVVDALQLAVPGGEHWLAHGAMNLGAGLGVAWVEMARGLLVHVVGLTADLRRVVVCRVLAPTEWNFHPSGGLARALSNLRGGAAVADACRLAVAYDPCVEFEVLTQHQQEAAHA
jgi:hypothetical protein